MNKRFREAASTGIHIETGFIELHKLLDHLQEIGPVIVLVDSNLLNCQTCKTSSVANIGSLVRIMLNFKFSFTGKSCSRQPSTICK